MFPSTSTSALKEVKMEVEPRLADNSNSSCNTFGSCPSLPHAFDSSLQPQQQQQQQLPYEFKTYSSRSSPKMSHRFRPLSMSCSYNGGLLQSGDNYGQHQHQHRLSRSHNFASQKAPNSTNLILSALSSIQGFTEEHHHKLLSFDRDARKDALVHGNYSML